MLTFFLIVLFLPMSWFSDLLPAVKCLRDSFSTSDPDSSPPKSLTGSDALYDPKSFKILKGQHTLI